MWSKALFFTENVINVHIRNLRKKIELNDKKPEIIETVWGYGYKLGQGVIIEN
ncbi:MAG: winged helix-turn-helix domain-containing protein [Acholeplasmataceae bacterium]